MLSDEWVANPTPEESAEIDRHNNGVDTVNKAMMLLMAMLGIGLTAMLAWHYI